MQIFVALCVFCIASSLNTIYLLVKGHDGDFKNRVNLEIHAYYIYQVFYTYHEFSDLTVTEQVPSVSHRACPMYFFGKYHLNLVAMVQVLYESKWCFYLHGRTSAYLFFLAFALSSATLVLQGSASYAHIASHSRSKRSLFFKWSSM